MASVGLNRGLVVSVVRTPGHSTNAFIDLQDALVEAGGSTGSDQIWVAAGTYYPAGAGNQSVSFDLQENVSLYGGFLGNETLRSKRDPEANETILSGDIDQDGDAMGSADPDNSFHVVKADGVNNTAVLNGFTISRGNAVGGGMDDNGGGILILDASPKIVRCTLSNNRAYEGAGIYVEVTGTAAPTVFNCSLFGNVALQGSGMRLEGDQETILVGNCLFFQQGPPGGAIYANGPDLDVRNCTFWFNDHNGCGSGQFRSENGSQVTITNSIIYAPNHGPHFVVETATGSSVTVSYSNVVGGLYVTDTGCAEVEGVSEGVEGSNIDVDPQFCDTDAPTNNYRLQDGSPSIDTGSTSAVPADIADVDDDGNTTETLPWDLDKRKRRFPGGVLVDMGAFEKQRPVECLSDFNASDVVDAVDLLVLLANWGTCVGCAADSNCDNAVDTVDLLELLGDWGPCPGSEEPEPDSLQEAVEDAGLEWPDDWDEFEDVVTDPEASQAEKDNYACWMKHYLDCHRDPWCVDYPDVCDDDDPWGGH